MHILDVLFPKRCVGCGKIGKYFCDRCRVTVRLIRPDETICPICGKPAIAGATHPRCKTRYSLDGLTSYFQYNGVVKKAIKALKYRFISDLVTEFVSLIPLCPINASGFVPIPLHPSRFRERGFNQADIVGGILAKRLHVPAYTNCLCRIKKTTPQVEARDRNNRLQNIQGAFMVNDNIDKCGKHIILFDDVFTTGATMRSAASTLKRHGVQSVWAVTIAR